MATYLVQALAEEGYRVAAIKHCHLGLQVDRSDSDTYRLYRSGAGAYAIPGQESRPGEMVPAATPKSSIAAVMGLSPLVCSALNVAE